MYVSMKFHGNKTNYVIMILFCIPYGNIFIKQFKKHIAEGKKISSSEDGNFNQVIFMEKRGKLLKTIFRFKINQ